MKKLSVVFAVMLAGLLFTLPVLAMHPHNAGVDQITAADLGVTISGPAMAYPGDTVNYVIDYVNNGADAAEGVMLMDRLSNGKEVRDHYFLQKLGSGYGKEPATDSASAATAMATGHKTDAGNLSWASGDPVGGELTTVAETLRAEMGYAIGVVSTVPFNHATPAAFVSHNVARGNKAEIAHEIIFTTTPEVVIGGGYDNSYFPLSNPDFDLLSTGMTSYTHVITRGAVVDGGEALSATAAMVDLSNGDKLFGLFGQPSGEFTYYEAADNPGSPAFTRPITDPTMADATLAALNVLSQDPDGFFVMFEQGDIDWSNHANDYEDMVGGVYDLEQAAKAAVAFVEDSSAMTWDNTLIILTSDHSNSYLRVHEPLGMGDLPAQTGSGDYDWSYPDGDVSYGTTNHTNELVTLWARGAGADLFDAYAGEWYPNTMIVDNTRIYSVTMEAATAGTKYIMIFVGDGMNLEHEMAASRYMYGDPTSLEWHGWGELADGWAGYCSTWDVDTYNKYAGTMGADPYDPTDFDPNVGYDTVLGGVLPSPAQAGDVFQWNLGDVANGASDTVTLTFGVPSGFSGAIVSTAMVDATSTDDDASNDVAQTYTAVSDGSVALERIGGLDTGGDGTAEIAAFDPASELLFVTNGDANELTIVDMSDPMSPVLSDTVDLSPYGGGINSVAVYEGLVVAAVAAVTETDPGMAVFFDVAGNEVMSVTVGALPDMVTFTPDGGYALLANEGEPDAVDPQGSVSLVSTTDWSVTTLDFTGFTSPTNSDVRVFPGKTLAEDVEPEYIAVSPDGSTAFVSLQENNALAIVDLGTMVISDVVGLGTKDHSLPGNELDASDDDGVIHFANWPVHGMYMPDAIAAFEVGGEAYVITANEGDARNEDERIKNLTLDPTAFPMSDTLQLDENLGRLEASNIDGDIDGDGDYDMLYSYGARSFSIWDAMGNLVFDSGDDLDALVAALAPAHFDDGRSDNKGSEPEGVTVGVIDGSTYAFVGLERFGGVMVYDVTDPMAPVFETYVNTTGAGVDISPEGLYFVSASDSPNGEPLLIVSYEVSGDVAVYQINMPSVSLTKAVETASDPVMGGDVVTYTLTIANSGTLTATEVVVEDMLPEAVEFGQLLGSATSIVLPPPALVWEPVLGPGDSHTIRFTAVVSTAMMYGGTTVTNTATFSTMNAGSGSADAAFDVAESGVYIYLPLLMRDSD